MPRSLARPRARSQRRPRRRRGGGRRSSGPARRAASCPRNPSRRGRCRRRRQPPGRAGWYRPSMERLAGTRLARALSAPFQLVDVVTAPYGRGYFRICLRTRSDRAGLNGCRGHRVGRSFPALHRGGRRRCRRGRSHQPPCPPGRPAGAGPRSRPHPLRRRRDVLLGGAGDRVHGGDVADERSERGSRPSARTRTTMSRSVRIPAHSPSWSRTGRPPTPLIRICWAASTSVVSGRTAATSVLMRSPTVTIRAPRFVASSSFPLPPPTAAKHRRRRGGPPGARAGAQRKGSGPSFPIRIRVRPARPSAG